jgi:hypothetical protein
MKVHIDTKFDVGDIAYYKVASWNSKYHDQKVAVNILAVRIYINEDRTIVSYDCETVSKNGTLAEERYIFNYDCTREHYFSVHPDYEPHPMSFDYDTVYELNQDVLLCSNGTVYGYFPPQPFRIKSFVFMKKILGWRDNEIIQCDLISGFNPQERDASICEFNRTCFIDKLPDDYFDKCWNGLKKNDIWTEPVPSKEKTRFEKLFSWLGITEQAKESYNKYQRKKLGQQSVDDILESLTEEQKKELAEKLKIIKE